MTLQELIEDLTRLRDDGVDPDTTVMFAHPSHDYWRTELASQPDNATVEGVEYSDYHNTYKTVTEEEEFDYEAKYGKELTKVVILR